MPQPTRADWISIFLLGFLWGGTFLVVSIALRGYGPFTVAAARTALGALALLTLLPLTGRRLPRLDLWPQVLPIGLLSTAFPFLLLSWGQTAVSSAFAGLSMAMVPLFVLPLAHFFSDERLTHAKSIGGLIGFAGVSISLGPSAFGGEGGFLPHLSCVAAALCYAIASILIRRFPPIDPLTLAAAGLLVGSAALLPAMLAAEGIPTWEGGLPSLALILLGVIPTAFAVALRVRVIRSAGSVFLTLTNYQVPLWSMALGTMVLGEALQPAFFASLTLILAGLAISQRGLPSFRPGTKTS
jgi:drug/metabolite transporter (DMT)-like permease